MVLLQDFLYVMCIIEPVIVIMLTFDVDNMWHAPLDVSSIRELEVQKYGSYVSLNILYLCKLNKVAC